VGGFVLFFGLSCCLIKFSSAHFNLAWWILLTFLLSGNDVAKS
jgi:hypothetical protein